MIQILIPTERTNYKQLLSQVESKFFGDSKRTTDMHKEEYQFEDITQQLLAENNTPRQTAISNDYSFVSKQLP